VPIRNEFAGKNNRFIDTAIFHRATPEKAARLRTDAGKFVRLSSLTNKQTSLTRDA
jgi:hypothetical protein